MYQQRAYASAGTSESGAEIMTAGMNTNRTAFREAERADSMGSPLDVMQPRARAASDTGDHTGPVPVARPDAGRVLIPIDATARSRWAIRHALAQHRAGAAIEAHLLFVAEPVRSLEVLRFRTQADIARFHAERAHWLIEDAATPLRQAGIPVQGHFREGDIAFEILDSAERLGCGRIFLPRPRPRWRTWASRDIVRQVLARAKAIDVVTIDHAGNAPATVMAHSV